MASKQFRPRLRSTESPLISRVLGLSQSGDTFVGACANCPSRQKWQQARLGLVGASSIGGQLEKNAKLIHEARAASKLDQVQASCLRPSMSVLRLGRLIAPNLWLAFGAPMRPIMQMAASLERNLLGARASSGELAAEAGRPWSLNCSEWPTSKEWGPECAQTSRKLASLGSRLSSLTATTTGAAQ